MRAEAQSHVDTINEALALLRRFLDWDRALRRLDEIRKHDYVLTPGRYVGAEAQDEDSEAFTDKMQRLTTQLYEQTKRGAELDARLCELLGCN